MQSIVSMKESRVDFSSSSSKFSTISFSSDLYALSEFIGDLELLLAGDVTLS
jgi:hypothetical protein